jgi:hypothetical protein
VPENERDNLFLKGALSLNDNLQLFSDSRSRVSTSPPVLPRMPRSLAMFTQYVEPSHRPAARQREAGVVQLPTYDWSIHDSRATTDSIHFVACGTGFKAHARHWPAAGERRLPCSFLHLLDPARRALPSGKTSTMSCPMVTKT